MAARPTPTTVPVVVIAKQPPTVAGLPILLGVQCRKEVEQIVTTTGADERFELDVGVVSIEGERDFKGPYVHGRRGDRFFYLSWGVADEAGTFHMFARAKLKLNDVPDALFEQTLFQQTLVEQALIEQRPVGDTALHCVMQATNQKHEPASGSIRPPEVTWSTTALHQA